MKQTLIGLGIVLLLVPACKKTPEAPVDPTPGAPIVADTTNNEVRISARLNRTWCDDSAAIHNCCVYINGVKADKALFQAHCHPADFFDALVAVGADPGSDMGNMPDSAAVPTGSRLHLTVRWHGSPKTYALDELVHDSLGRGFEIRMHNSRDRAVSTNMGCIYCHTACQISITSNAKYNYWEKVHPVSKFLGRPDLLPADKTNLVLAFKLLN